MKQNLLYLALSGWLWTVPALAQAASDTNPQPLAQAASRPASALTDGEVRKVEKDTGKITIRHGAILNLDMPPMTMVFRVSDPTLLDSVQVGDQVRFAAEKLGVGYTVTLLQRRD
jgi:Cu/Ag efflux protein CusF